MIESIEGKRGMPRLRPPYVAQVGLFGRPTLEHNFETLYWVRDMLERGPEWFAAHGRNGRKGLRSFSVSGRVREPGVKLAPAGITIQELIDEYCGGMQDGHKFYAYLPGGASGGILPAAMNDIPLDFDTLQPYGCFIGSAAVWCCPTRTARWAPRATLLRFFRDESCGQCTPCRAGTAKALASSPSRSGTSRAGRPVAGDARRVDLRPGPGRARIRSTASSSTSRTNSAREQSLRARPAIHGKT
jgi:NADH:ubiquinone oxidoreductase subunit F (NADH-binding)